MDYNVNDNMIKPNDVIIKLAQTKEPIYFAVLVQFKQCSTMPNTCITERRLHTGRSHTCTSYMTTSWITIIVPIFYPVWSFIQWFHLKRGIISGQRWGISGKYLLYFYLLQKYQKDAPRMKISDYFLSNITSLSCMMRT